jgi:hypothetical protein
LENLHALEAGFSVRGLGLGWRGVGVWLGLLIGLSAAARLAVFRFVRLCRREI